jgi:fructosamine-3-kinase
VLVGGGSLSQVLRIRLADGRTVISKGGPDPELESEMLGAIRAAGAPAPQVFAVSKHCLVMEALHGQGRLSDAWADLGAVLAKLHATSGFGYGWHSDYAFDDVAIANSPATDWAEFWAQRRLLNHLPYIAPSLARRVEALALSIHEYLPAAPRPSLLHGDLWGGNILVNGKQVTGLIDPACYFGHGEVDIAMLGLFDQPNAEFYSSYDALEPGHRERIAIYSLWPALVHVRLFGAGYIPMAERLLAAAGS